MAGITVRMTAGKQYTLSQIQEKIRLIDRIEEVSRTVEEIGGVTIWILAYERYYFRIGGYASMTVILTEHDREQTACIVISGGGEGKMGFSYGANRNFAVEGVEVLESCGFQVVESDPNPRKQGFRAQFLK